jgi:hypothetical protein
MKHPKTFVITWTIAFLGLLAVAGSYQSIALNDDIPNNAISHGVTFLSWQHPWLVPAFVIFSGVLFAVSITCALHWQPNEQRPFWWPLAWWEKPAANSENTNLSEDK